MNTDSTLLVPATDPILVHDVPFHRSLCWGAILAGVVTAIGIHLLLLALGVGIGLASFSPMTDQNPAENFSVGSAIAWSLCALVSLYVGGWIAGTFSFGPKSGCLHGIVVWSVTMIITFFLVSTGGGLALGGAVKALGAGLGMTGQAAVGGASDPAKIGAKRGSDQVGSFIDEALKSSPTNATASTTIRAKREIGFAVTRLFNPANDVNSPENRMAVEKALTQYAGMSEADAKKTVDEWMNSYNALKAELEKDKAVAEQKARELAEKASKHLACAATVAFFSFIVGLVVTILGAICGAKKTYRHTALAYIS